MAHITDLGVDNNGILQPLLANRFKASFEHDGEALDILTVQLIKINDFRLSDDESIKFTFEVDTGCDVIKALERFRQSENKATIKVCSLDGDSTTLMTIAFKNCLMLDLYFGQYAPDYHRVEVDQFTEEFSLKKKFASFIVERTSEEKFSFDYAKNSSVKVDAEFFYEDYEISFPESI